MTWKVTAVSILALALASARAHTDPPGTDDAARPKGVADPQTTTQTSPAVIELQALTAYNPDLISRIRPRFDARVGKVHVSVGQKVHKGDPLIVLHSAELASAKKDLQTKHVQWKRDRRLLDARQRLNETGETVLEVMIDTINDENRSHLAFTLARERLVVMKVPRTEIARLVGEDGGDGHSPLEDEATLTLTSPADGIVIERSATPGNHYAPSNVLLVVAGWDPLWVVAELSENYRTAVKAGQAAEIAFPFRKSRIAGKVEFVSSEPSKQIRSVKLRASIPNADGQLKSGQMCQMRVAAP